MIFIAGASKGIGKYLFTNYKERGEYVVGTYHTTVNPFLQHMDVTDYESVKKAMVFIPIGDNEISMVITAGVYDAELLHKSAPDEWAKVINTNIMGAYNVIHNVLPLMHKHGFGRIILFSSVVPQMGVRGASAYSTSKAALWGLAKSVSAENASKGVTCNCINLGYSELGMGEDALSYAARLAILDKIPTKRFCSGEEIMNTVDYLIKTPYITGSAIDISGGIV